MRTVDNFVAGQVHTGHDDATLAMLQDELDMVKIGKDPAKVPAWLRANKPMIPDFVARDPKVFVDFVRSSAENGSIGELSLGISETARVGNNRG